MSALLDLVTLRPMRDDERNFVRQSWLRSYRALCEWVPKQEYFALHWNVIEGLMSRATTIVAVEKADDSHALGWACGEASREHPLMHWCYVKQTYRGQGLGARLLEGVLDGSGNPAKIVRTLTHLPPKTIGEKLRANGWAIHPTLAFYLALEGKEAA